MKSFLQKSLIVVTGLASLPAVASFTEHEKLRSIYKKPDPRFLSLRNFFRARHCPVEQLTSVFLQEADAHHLDWRLLPGLSFVESGGGRNARGNNIFGWNNGNRSFRSIREGIHYVASRLAYSNNYRNKSVTEKLRTYNPAENYSENVKSVMLRISNAQALE